MIGRLFADRGISDKFAEEIFDLAQIELKKYEDRNKSQKEKHLNRCISHSIFSQMIYCGCCGATYKKVYATIKKEVMCFWGCSNTLN